MLPINLQILRKHKKQVIAVVIAVAGLAAVLGYNILTPEQVEVLEQLAETPVPAE